MDDGSLKTTATFLAILAASSASWAAARVVGRARDRSSITGRLAKAGAWVILPTVAFVSWMLLNWVQSGK